MDKKNTFSDANLIKVDSNDIKFSGTKSGLISLGKNIAIPIAFEASKALIPIALAAIKNKNEYDIETQGLVRDDKRKILNKRADTLLMQIEKEEAKADYNQDRINKWHEELEDIMEEQENMGTKSESFTKALLFTFKDLINSKPK